MKQETHVFDLFEEIIRHQKERRKIQRRKKNKKMFQERRKKKKKVVHYRFVSGKKNSYSTILTLFPKTPLG